MSRKEEEGELAQRRLRRQDVQDRAVANYFRCVNTGTCMVAKLWPDRLEELPRYDERADRFICPSCASELVVGPPRAPAVQVIVLLDGAERARLLLEDSVDLEIGRVDAKGCIGLDRHLASTSVATLSRRHIRLQMRGSDVLVTDLSSKNGTSMRLRRDPAQAARKLRPNVPERWLLRDALVMPGGITLERSGRRHPMGGDRPSGKTTVNPDAAVTTFVRSDRR